MVDVCFYFCGFECLSACVLVRECANRKQQRRLMVCCKSREGRELALAREDPLSGNSITDDRSLFVS